MSFLRRSTPSPTTTDYYVGQRQVVRLERRATAATGKPSVTVLRMHRDGSPVTYAEGKAKPWLKLATVAGIVIVRPKVAVVVQWRWGRR